MEFENNFNNLSSDNYSKLNSVVEKQNVKTEILKIFYDFNIDLKMEIEQFKNKLAKSKNNSNIKKLHIENQLKNLMLKIN